MLEGSNVFWAYSSSRVEEGGLVCRLCGGRYLVSLLVCSIKCMVSEGGAWKGG